MQFRFHPYITYLIKSLNGDISVQVIISIPPQLVT